MFLIPTKGPEDWRNLLVDPVKQWRPWYSAHALAHTWEDARGFPPEVNEALARVSTLKDSELLLAIPEYKVGLPGGGATSQNDLFALARTQAGLATFMIEGKVEEPFDSLVSEWFADPSTGKEKRLEYLCEVLGLDQDSVMGIRYQLLHRTASAVIEAKRFTAEIAVMLIHSFSPGSSWFEDYAAFAALYGIKVEVGRIHFAGTLDGIDLYLGWVHGDAQ